MYDELAFINFVVILALSTVFAAVILGKMYMG